MKTVWRQRHMGSNPILSAHLFIRWKSGEPQLRELRYSIVVLRFRQIGEVPKRLKGHPWKGCRSLIAAREFKSLLLRLKQLRLMLQQLAFTAGCEKTKSRWHQVSCPKGNLIEPDARSRKDPKDLRRSTLTNKQQCNPENS